MIQFFAPDIATDPVLPESDSQHCVRVLRMREGDEVQVVDGAGHRYHCHIAIAHSKRTLLAVDAVEAQPRVWPSDIAVAVAPTKHIDRMEWLVEKLVEIAAMKQSLKAILPRVDDMTPLGAYLAEAAAPGEQRFVGYCDESLVERRLLARAYTPGAPVRILIGPEGDFTPDEIRSALDAGYLAVTMGDNRLRTETAALVGCDTIHIVNQLAV